MIKITKRDCIGDLKGFSIPIIKKMIERQVEQGNPANIKVFQECRFSNKSVGGFNFNETKEGHYYWFNIIFNKKMPISYNKTIHTRLTAKLAKQYGFKQSIISKLYYKDINDIMWLYFDAISKRLGLCVETSFKTPIPCYLENVQEIYHGITGKNLELIKK